MRVMRVRRPALRQVACAAALALCFALAPGLAQAQNAARKAGRGLAGMTTSWLELPGNVYAVTQDRGPAWGFTLGFVQGLGMIPVRTLVGVYEFVTCPLPAPAGFEPIIEPEFPWSYFEGGGGGGGPNRAGRHR